MVLFIAVNFRSMHSVVFVLFFLFLFFLFSFVCFLVLVLCLPFLSAESTCQLINMEPKKYLRCYNSTLLGGAQASMFAVAVLCQTRCDEHVFLPSRKSFRGSSSGLFSLYDSSMPRDVAVGMLLVGCVARWAITHCVGSVA